MGYFSWVLSWLIKLACNIEGIDVIYGSFYLKSDKEAEDSSQNRLAMPAHHGIIDVSKTVIQGLLF